MNRSANIDDLSVAQMRLFARVAERQGISAAARDCGLSQPAASRSIAAMERTLGGALFSRTTRKVRPTSLGALVLARVASILDEVDRVDQLCQAHTTTLAGHLRVAAPGAFGRRFVAPVVARFLAAHPKVTIDLSLVDRRIDLTAQGIDLAVRVGDAGHPVGRTRVLGHSPNVFVAAPGLLGPRRSLSEALDLPVAVPPELRPRVLTTLTGGAKLQVRMVADDIAALRVAAMEGIVVTLLPQWLVEDDLAAGRLTSLGGPPARPAPIRVLFPVAPRRPTRALADALVAALGPRFAR